MYPYLVADIGGTNARFAIVTGKSNTGFNIEHVQVLSGSELPSLSDAIRQYLAELPDVKPTAACVAIAGPVDGDVFQMTNLPWTFSKKAVKEEFGFSHFEVLNDFAAVSVATSALQESEVVTVKPGTVNETGNKAVFGAGTGLGVAGLAYTPSGWSPIASEGGHVNLAPSTALEAQIVAAGIEKYGHFSAEMVISGPGLVNLYQILCELKGEESKSYEPKDVTGKALDGSDPLCVQTLATFCSFVGAFAGNLALTYGAKGGVYIAGGVIPRFAEYVKTSDLPKQFLSKGVMRRFVEDIPVFVVDHPYIAFMGAAAWLEQADAA